MKKHSFPKWHLSGLNFMSKANALHIENIKRPHIPNLIFQHDWFLTNEIPKIACIHNMHDTNSNFLKIIYHANDRQCIIKMIFDKPRISPTQMVGHLWDFMPQEPK